MRRVPVAVAMLAAVIMVGPVQAAAGSPEGIAAALADRPLDGAGNNAAHPTWGQAGRRYLRVTPAVYADGVARPVPGPPARYVSNRVFADGAQNVFSENGVTQWGFAWGQFLDHTIGLRQEAGGEARRSRSIRMTRWRRFGTTWGRSRSIGRRRRPARA